LDPETKAPRDVKGLLTVGAPPAKAVAKYDTIVSLATVGVAETEGVVLVPVAIVALTSRAPTPGISTT
jgi:hypothetical protein